MRQRQNVLRQSVRIDERTEIRSLIGRPRPHFNPSFDCQGCFFASISCGAIYSSVSLLRRQVAHIVDPRAAMRVEAAVVGPTVLSAGDAAMVDLEINKLGG